MAKIPYLKRTVSKNDSIEVILDEFLLFNLTTFLYLAKQEIDIK